jgi:putative membrane-bound dehydrogenase-like protein
MLVSARAAATILFFSLRALAQAPAQLDPALSPPVALPRLLRPDLEVELFCREPDIVTPIQLDVDRRGRVWAIESNTHFPKSDYDRHPSDRLLILEDSDHDGKADRIRVFADGFHQSMALSLRGDGEAYFATRREVMLLLDADGDDRVDRTVSLAKLATAEEYPHNGLSGFAFDDLGHVFFAIGENMGVPYRLTARDGTTVTGGPEGGSIFRMRPDGSGLEHWAVGFWNTFHLAFDAFGRLFAVDNDPDSRPPCRLLHIVRGGDYGYRRWLGRKGLHPFTAWNGELPGTLPMVSGTGEAPSGIVAYERSGLPADLRGKLIVTSWGDHRIDSFQLEERGASFRSHPEPLLAGGEMFRPVGIAVAPDGSLYFSDWVDQEYHVHGKGRIWRLRSKKTGTVNPAGEPPAGENVESGAQANPTLRARYRALVASPSSRGGSDSAPGARRDPDPDVRSAAVRLLGEQGGLPADLFNVLLGDPSPRVRLEAIVSFRSAKDFSASKEAREVLAEMASTEADPFLKGAAIEALSRLEEARDLQEMAKASDPRRRLAALLALRRMRAARARESIPDLLRDPDLDVRRAALQWVGEERLTEYRLEIEKAFTSGPISRALFDAHLAAASLLRGEAPDARDTTTTDDFLLPLALDKSRPEGVRALALRSVSQGHPKLTANLFRELLSSPDLQLRLEAVRSLRESGIPEVADMLLGLARSSAETSALRREAIAGISRFLPAKGPELEALLKDADPLLRMEAGRALRFGAQIASRKVLSEDEKQELLSGGDPADGETLFFYPRGPRCSSCHGARGRGGIAGPDLSAAGFTSRAKLLDSILSPRKEISPQYTTWLILARSGPHTGTLLGEDADGSLRLGTASGEVERIGREEIESRAMSSTSLMPDDIALALTVPELKNLLAYLENLR